LCCLVCLFFDVFLKEQSRASLMSSKTEKEVLAAEEA
jgi:hypothetical protein